MRRWFHGVVRITWYAAGWQKEKYEAFNADIGRAPREFDLGTATIHQEPALEDGAE